MFLTFEVRLIILFWDICDLLDRVSRTRCWFVSDKPNFFITVVNAFEFKEITEMQNHAHLKCFLEMTKPDLVVASTRHHRARLLKYYPRQPCPLSFVKSRMRRPLQTHFLLFPQIFSIRICIHAGNRRVYPRILASGPKPCAGNKLFCCE